MQLPIEHLNQIPKRYPNAWKQINEFRRDKGKDLPDWPEWCFLPMAAWYAIVSAENGTHSLSLDLISDVSKLAALGAWRYTQGIYQFEPEFYQEIVSTVPVGDMPSEVLYRLPEWSMYIETPSAKWFDESMHGFWVHLEFDMNTHRHELRLLLNTASTLVPVPIHIGNWTLTEAVDRAISESKKYTEIQFPAETAEKMAENLYGLVSLVLYVCSEEPEIDDLRTPGEAPSRPQPTKTKKGWKLFPAKKVKIWTVGKEASKAIRSFNEELQAGSTGSKVRPHVRRAHWHGYWTGKRGTSEQRFIYKWIPALIINVK